MSILNASEQAVTNYFAMHGVEHHWVPRTSDPTPDLKVVVDPKPVIVEIKEFNRSVKLRRGGYRAVPFVRNKIKESWRQFENYSDHACCPMLYNAESVTVFLQPELILSAMFGDYLETIDPVKYRFSGAASMRPDRNTYISAVAGLFPLHVRRNIIEASRLAFQLTQGFTRELTDGEVLQIHRETARYLGEVNQVIRAVVVEKGSNL